MLNLNPLYLRTYILLASRFVLSLIGGIVFPNIPPIPIFLPQFGLLAMILCQWASSKDQYSYSIEQRLHCVKVVGVCSISHQKSVAKCISVRVTRSEYENCAILPDSWKVGLRQWRESESARYRYNKTETGYVIEQ